MNEFQLNEYNKIKKNIIEKIDDNSSKFTNFTYPCLNEDKTDIVGYYGSEGLNKILSQLENDENLLRKKINKKFFGGKLKKDEEKLLVYKLGNSILGTIFKLENLKLFSIKIYEMLMVINKFVEKNKNSGICMIYSDFKNINKHLLENILLINGYGKFGADSKFFKNKFISNDNLINSLGKENLSSVKIILTSNLNICVNNIKEIHILESYLMRYDNLKNLSASGAFIYKYTVSLKNYEESIDYILYKNLETKYLEEKKLERKEKEERTYLEEKKLRENNIFFTDFDDFLSIINEDDTKNQNDEYIKIEKYILEKIKQISKNDNMENKDYLSSGNSSDSDASVDVESENNIVILVDRENIPLRDVKELLKTYRIESYVTKKIKSLNNEKLKIVDNIGKNSVDFAIMLRAQRILIQNRNKKVIVFTKDHYGKSIKINKKNKNRYLSTGEIDMIKTFLNN